MEENSLYRTGKQEPSLPLIDETTVTEVVADRLTEGRPLPGNKDRTEPQQVDDDDEADDEDEEADDEEDDELLNSSPLWQQAEEDGWELTWPIWHMLPRRERKELAHKHGYNSIGEFEEYMSLQRAERDSSEATVVLSSSTSSSSSAAKTTKQSQSQSSLVLGQSHISKPYANHMIYPFTEEEEAEAVATTSKTQGKEEPGDEQDKKKKKNTLSRMTSSLSTTTTNDDYNTLEEAEEKERQNQRLLLQSQDATTLSREELIALGGYILLLPEELTQQLFDWLPVDMYGTLALVSPHWKHLTRTEPIYQRLCERLYLNQSKKRQLQVHKFGHCYRNMLLHRPRVRAAGGFYVLKYSHVKRIQRDMWTEIPVGAILEVVYYRYLYFQEDGRVLYALTSTSPHEMFQRLLKVCLNSKKHDKDGKGGARGTTTVDKSIVWGTYQVQKDNVSIVARQPWHIIQFELTIQNTTTSSKPPSMWDDPPDGKFGRLTLDRHLSSPSGCFEEWSQDRVEYKVPEESFRFIRSNRL